MKRKTPRTRLDTLLMTRGLAPNAQKAQAMILAGEVFVNGVRVSTSGTAIAEDALVKINSREQQYASRGGFKLEGALRDFHVDPAGKICLDVGASTGGFTDCLLQHGASRVYAIDVGTGQLDWRLRNDPRVVVAEQVNARYLSRKEVPEPIDLAVCDVSFISVTMILPALVKLLASNAEMVILVNPQLE